MFKLKGKNLFTNLGVKNVYLNLSGLSSYCKVRKLDHNKKGFPQLIHSRVADRNVFYPPDQNNAFSLDFFIPNLKQLHVWFHRREYLVCQSVRT